MDIVFICHKGELEIKSVLLAASLRYHLGENANLIAAIPEDKSLSTLSKKGNELLEKLNVKRKHFSIKFPDYLIGNKICFYSDQFSRKNLLFLDSDILCMRTFEESELFISDVNLRAAGSATYSREEKDWRSIYSHFNIPFDPKEQVVTNVSGERTFSYYNAGVIAVKSPATFWNSWQSIAEEIYTNLEFPNKFPWLDQIALPLVLKAKNLGRNELNEGFNFPLHRKTLKSKTKPILVHYHSPDHIRREHVCNMVVLQLCYEFPELKKILFKKKEWAVLLKPYSIFVEKKYYFFNIKNKIPISARTSEAEIDMIISGIPRSGTSFVSQLIDDLENTVVLNEPKEVAQILNIYKRPFGLNVYYQQLREKILSGESVENKEYKNQIIRDTFHRDKYQKSYKNVNNPAFLLATKNTLSYLIRLNRIFEEMPDAKYVLCIRNPYDTLKSWFNTFQHLRDADLEHGIIGSSEDKYLYAWQKKLIKEIKMEEEEFTKRILLWNFLAKCILSFKGKSTLLRFEEFTKTPENLGPLILEPTSRENLHPLNIDPGGNFSSTQIEKVKKHCSEIAAEFSYKL